MAGHGIFQAVPGVIHPRFFTGFTILARPRHKLVEVVMLLIFDCVNIASAARHHPRSGDSDPWVPRWH